MRFPAVLAVAASSALSSLSYASTLTPPVLPLIVRNPYLSTWLANAREEPWTRWPMFYTGQSIGFSVLAQTPDTATVYPLLGRPQDFLESDSDQYDIKYPTYLGAQYDASTTNLTYSISSGGTSGRSVELILSFLSPITPTSTLRQSIPASYLSIHVEGDLDVAVYVDVNGQWVSGNGASEIEWSLKESGKTGLKTWAVKKREEQVFVEFNDRAEWGTLHLTGPAEATHESGNSVDLRRRFARSGTLRNTVDEHYRRIDDNDAVFAFSKSFNLSSKASVHGSKQRDNVLFTIAHLQDPVVQFASARGLTYMRPLWMSYFFTDEKLIHAHYEDYARANAMAANYSAQVAKDAYASGSDNYKDIVELSARQVLGATVFSGTPENPLLFLKEISSNGNCQTVDVIFPAFPFFLYTNPRWLAYILEPLLEHMLSGQYPNSYTMHDLGTHFPNMTGHPDGNDEYMPVEECGDILIMAMALMNSLAFSDSEVPQSIWESVGSTPDAATILAAADDISPFYLPSSLDTTVDGVFGIDNQWGGALSKHQGQVWVKRTYPLWKQWTKYLIDFALYPHNQLCTDDFAGWLALQTNLALKGIIGIRAMSGLAEAAGKKDDMAYYQNISDAYIKQWVKEGMSRDGGRAKLAYDWYGSWTTLYSLYADALLCFHPSGESSPSTSIHGAMPQTPLTDGTPSLGAAQNFIPDHVYKTVSKWYGTSMQKYGLPLDSRHLYTKSDWEFQAAAVAGKTVRADILDRVARWLNETKTDRPFTDLYETEGEGGFPGPDFFARPVIGSHFAFLTLERACGGKANAAFMYDD